MNKVVLVLIALLLIFERAQGQEETRNSRAYADNLAIPGAFVQTQDDKFIPPGIVSSWVTGFQNYANRAVIELGLDEDRHIAHTSPIKICAQFDVEIMDAAYGSTVLTAQQLDISYNPNELTRYKDKAQLYFENIYKVKVFNVIITSTSFTAPCSVYNSGYALPDVYLQAEVSTNRIYPSTQSDAFGPGDITSYSVGATEQVVAWPFFYGATEYELEYTFVDNYSMASPTAAISPSLLTYDFEHDATRIVTNNNHYSIPLTHGHGYLLYRVRPKGTSNGTNKIEGLWYPSVSSGSVSTAMSSYSNVVLVNPSFPADALNWSVTKTFAESGRSGTGVSYSDAMGLSRQSLARLNTEGKTIAQSTLFDHYQRPAINLLPSPVAGTDFSYRFGLSVFTPTSGSSVTFDKRVFDKVVSTSTCSPPSYTLDPVNSSGAANYFSPHNPDQEKYQGYLPDAEGLPYTQVNYSGDGLNRVLLQTQPGKLHQLNSNYTTRFEYAKPTQVELDRLFGAQSGITSYYHKNSVVDANGQRSATYTDAYGRTIATSLMGLNPSNTQSLSNMVTTATLSANLTAGQDNVEDDENYCRTINTKYIVNGNASQERYYYAATLGAFSSSCTSVCYNCLYDLQISITDACGNEYFANSTYTFGPGGCKIELGPAAPYQPTTCSTAPTTVVTGSSLLAPFAITFGAPGVYNIYKKICVSNKPVEDYAEAYLAGTNCATDKCNLFNTLLSQTNFSGSAPMTCAECNSMVASYSTAMAAASNTTGNSNVTTVPNPTLSQATSYDGGQTVVTVPYGSLPATGPTSGGLAAGNPTANTGPQAVYLSPPDPAKISEAYEACAELCAPKDQCTVSQRLLESDFYPGTGQYAATSTSAWNWPKSIFNPTNSLLGTPGTTVTWATASNSYSNAAGQLDHVIINGVSKAPKDLTKDEFIANFRKSWAKTLVKYHPETCKAYFYCKVIRASLDYDEQFLKINHFDQACGLGYTRPVACGSCSYAPAVSCSVLADPIGTLAIAFPSSTVVSMAVQQFTNQISSNYSNSGMDIYTYLALQSNTYLATSGATFTGAYFGSDPCNADADWASFKSLYMARKEALYNSLYATFSTTPSAFSYTGTACIAVTGSYTTRFPAINDDTDELLPAISGTAASTFYTNALGVDMSSTLSVSSHTDAMSQFTAGIPATSSGSLSAVCGSACSSYTAGWDQDLTAACPLYVAKTATITNLKTNILNALVNVCQLGCDYNTSMSGASSASPGLSYTLPTTTVAVTNFQQVLDYYLGSANACTAVISSPPPYPVTMSGTVAVVSKKSLSACKCDMILQNDADFAAMQATLGLPTGVTYAWQLFEYTYGFDLAEYNRLKCICNAASGHTWTAGYPWTTGQVDALYAQYTGETDPRFVCNACLSCTQVAQSINGFTASLPVSSTLTSIAGKINSSYGNQLYALNVLNSIYGDHSLNTYLDLYNDCGSYYSTNSLVANTFSNNLNAQAGDIFNYLNALVKTKQLTSNHTMDLCKDNMFFLSSLYSGTLPVIPTYTYQQTNTSASLSASVYSGTTALFGFSLNLPAGYGGGWSSLSYLHDLVAWCPAPQSAGPVYQFKVQATTSSYSVITLTGLITHTNFPIASLSSGSFSGAGTYTAPALCPAKATATHDPAVVALINSAMSRANYLYAQQRQALKADFMKQYKAACLATLTETLVRSYSGGDEYNYTLYYYDVSGNLYRTVAPQGADPGVLSTLTTALPPTSTVLPAYSGSAAVALNYATEYHYNSYNQPYEENSVDGGLTRYYYDDAGRLLASQNAKQRAAGGSTINIFSYTLYDGMGRVTETGVVGFGSAATVTLASNLSSFQANVLAVATRSEVTRIFYDRACSTTSVTWQFSPTGQSYLRNRVSYVTYCNVSTSNTNTALYDQATYYSYDDQGHVKTLVQHNRQADALIGLAGFFKRIDYEYEEISGNMVKASYEKGRADQFTHKYYYDADNRLHEVYTSSDGLNWDRDAKYFYYAHGPLARIERADKKVQGSDYFYTIHGWIKGLNSDALVNTADAGKDGTTGSRYLSSYADVHRWLAKDAMGYSLNYYDVGAGRDYNAIKTYTTGDQSPLMSLGGFTTSPFELNSTGSGADGPSLFNGNISSMTTDFISKDPSLSAYLDKPYPQLTAYRYDQLHRLRTMKSFRAYSAAASTWSAAGSGTYDDAYKMSLSYDLNGNIQALQRYGPPVAGSGPALMDDLTYSYYDNNVYNTLGTLGYNSNKLRCVTDAVGYSTFAVDIDDHGCNLNQDPISTPSTPGGLWRYEYDEAGNLVKDLGEYIYEIKWTADHKVKSITRDASTMLAAIASSSLSGMMPDIEYEYNAQRQRVAKIVKPREAVTGTLTPTSQWHYTYYVYDASGNVMATYERSSTLVPGQSNYYKDKLELGAQHVYGSERLALARPSNTTATAWAFTGSLVTGGGVTTTEDDLLGYTEVTVSIPAHMSHQAGYKDFELTNHLGNVIATVSDRKIQASFGAGSCIKTYDFSTGVPAGPDINYNNINLAVSGGSLICTIINSGGISGINPKFGNNLSTSTVYQVDFDFNPGNLTTSDGLYIVPFDFNGGFWLGSYFWNSGAVPPAGHYSYTYTPTVAGPTYTTYMAFNTNASSTHSFIVDNISLCVVGTGSTVTSYSPDITSHTDYYAGGQQMAGRTWVGGDEYRYSHNGHEKENEIYAYAQSAENWMYDSRILRRWEIDPVLKEWESPYAAFDNNPILFADPLGLDGDDKGNKGAVKGSSKGSDLKNGNTVNVGISEKDKNNIITVARGQDSPNISGDKFGMSAMSESEPTLASATTYGAEGGTVAQATPHAAFSVSSIGIGGGLFGAGVELSLKRFETSPNPFTKDFLYPNETFWVMELDAKGGSHGADISGKTGMGYLSQPDPWTPLSRQINNLTDYDREATLGYLTGSITKDVSINPNRLNYSMIGVSYGFKTKIQSPSDVSIAAGAGGNWILSSDTAPKSIYDSAKTAYAHPNHHVSQSFIGRYGYGLRQPTITVKQ